MTLSKKSDVSKIVFHIRNNPNHAEIFRQFQIKDGKIKEPIVLISDVKETQTGENSELFKGSLFEQLYCGAVDFSCSTNSKTGKSILYFRVFSLLCFYLFLSEDFNSDRLPYVFYIEKPQRTKK